MYARVTEGSPCDGDEFTAHHVVHNLVSAEHVYGVGSVIAIYGDAYDLMEVLHLVLGRLNGSELGIKDSRYGVLGKQGND